MFKWILRFTICATDSQKVQTVQSWLAQATSSFVDAKVADHVLAWAQDTMKKAVFKNLEEPEQHFQRYGAVPLSKRSQSLSASHVKLTLTFHLQLIPMTGWSMAQHRHEWRCSWKASTRLRNIPR